MLTIQVTETEVLIGAADGYSGLDESSLKVTINNAGARLTDKRGGIWSAPAPAGALTIVAKVKDRAGTKDYGYWFRNYNLEAKKLLAAARDPKKIGDAFKAFEAVQTSFTEFVKSKGTDLNSSFQPFARDADSFFNAATKLHRDARDGADLREARQSLVSAYNSLISMANSLYQVESAGALK